MPPAMDSMLVAAGHDDPNRTRNKDGLVDEPNVDHPLVEVCLTPSKGLGLFAKQDIECGTRILSETPLVEHSVHDVTDYPALRSALDKLSAGELSHFHALDCNKEVRDSVSDHPILKEAFALGRSRKDRHADDLRDFLQRESKTLATFITNAVHMKSRGYGVFPLYGRVNHSCMPNIHQSYNPSLRTHTVHAIRDISAGEEILACYIDSAQPLEDRSELLGVLGIDCYCEACLPSAESKETQYLRCNIADLKRNLAAYEGNHTTPPHHCHESNVIPHNPKEALAEAEDLIMFLKEAGLVGMVLANTYRKASKYSLQLGLVERAKGFAADGAEVELYCLGPETEYMEEPANAASWMKHLQWAAEKDAVKLRMCEKREAKEAKRAGKKAEKKAKR